MKKTFLILVGAVIIAFFIFKNLVQEKVLSPIGSGKTSKEKTLQKYSYTVLHKTSFFGDKILIDKLIKDEDDFSSYLFYFYLNKKKVSGLMNIPKKEGSYPLVIMIRGYTDKKNYTPGLGTSHGGEYLAANGFITLAPDFLGYGASNKASPDALEDRFQTYVSVLELIASCKNLNNSLGEKSLPARYDGVHLGIWGHSNGGQIALSVLEISGQAYPTVLWAPVSKPFPYSILYYTDDVDDHGKALRKLVAKFEEDYNSEKYSPTNYLDWIKAPIAIHQGGADDLVPQKWSDNLADALKKKEKNVEYYIYPKEDHNFTQGSWTQVIERTVEFYKKWFKLD